MFNYVCCLHLKFEKFHASTEDHLHVVQYPPTNPREGSMAPRHILLLWYRTRLNNVTAQLARLLWRLDHVVFSSRISLGSSCFLLQLNYQVLKYSSLPDATTTAQSRTHSVSAHAESAAEGGQRGVASCGYCHVREIRWGRQEELPFNRHEVFGLLVGAADYFGTKINLSMKK